MALLVLVLEYTECKNIIAVSSWTLGAMLTQRFGIGTGEVITLIHILQQPGA